ncbi:MAG: SDR family NAD(P)-dependent oxidoreductase, partial [Clostridiales bacterium]|nr:SDR family NAD(P)-dependent oxidoreductase [Clostridiales bacterium]
MNRLASKVALVAGGAIGIGRADCILFAREGAKVAVGDINETEGRRTVEDIRKEGGDAIFVKLDVSREEDWKTAIAETIKAYGKINILILNAGISLGKNIEDTSL